MIAEKVSYVKVIHDIPLQMESGYVNFELKLPRGASVGLYARRNALPTHTNYDLMEVIKGLKDSDKLTSSSRSTRAIKVKPFVLFAIRKSANYLLVPFVINSSILYILYF